MEREGTINDKLNVILPVNEEKVVRKDVESRAQSQKVQSSKSNDRILSTQVNIEPSVTVRFQLLPSNQMVTLTCALKTTIQQLKERFGADLKMNKQHLQFMKDTNSPLINANETLSDLGGQPNGTVQLKLSSIDQVNYPLRAYTTDSTYNLTSDVITVQVKNEPGSESAYKTINVEIERPSNSKHPFLGGWHDTRNGRILLNASAQTRKLPKKDDGIERNARDTQTVVVQHMKLQTRQDMSTQMTKPGVFVSRIEDKMLKPRPYQTADQLLAIQISKAIIIQKYFRRWLGKRRFNEIKAAFDQRCEWEKQKEIERIQLLENRRKNDIERRLNPKSKDDFELLYSALEKWRNEEMSKINETKTGAARKAALAMLVDQEAELIATIERYKIEAGKENKEKDIQKLLQKV
jgi:IQ and ubiquitin-like domain-containing protein